MSESEKGVRAQKHPNGLGGTLRKRERLIPFYLLEFEQNVRGAMSGTP
jgi:hypothetical protein